MKIHNVLLVLVIAALPNSLLADSFLSEQPVKYLGDQDARDICRAVVNDDAQALKRGLKLYKSSLVYRYNVELISTAVSGRFTCDGKELLTFAHEIGAENIDRYLQGGVVTVEEYVSNVD